MIVRLVAKSPVFYYIVTLMSTPAMAVLRSSFRGGSLNGGNKILRINLKQYQLFVLLISCPSRVPNVSSYSAVLLKRIQSSAEPRTTRGPPAISAQQDRNHSTNYMPLTGFRLR